MNNLSRSYPGGNGIHYSRFRYEMIYVDWDIHNSRVNKCDNNKFDKKDLEKSLFQKSSQKHTRARNHDTKACSARARALSLTMTPPPTTTTGRTRDAWFCFPRWRRRRHVAATSSLSLSFIQSTPGRKWCRLWVRSWTWRETPPFMWPQPPQWSGLLRLPL